MRADQDVDLSAGEPGHRRTLLGRGPEAGDLLDRHRIILQALGEGAVVLLGQDRRRHEQHHLLAVLHRLERAAQRDLGLAVADVAADQSVHRARRFHVGFDEFDRVALVGGLDERERVLKLSLPVAVGRKGVALTPFALGVQVQQLAGHLLGRPASPGLHRLPARPPQLRQRWMAAAGADVAADLGQLVDRDEHAIRARVLQVQVVAGDAGDRLGVKSGEAGDAVVLVDDDVPRAQVGEAPQHPAPARAIRTLGGAPPATEQPVLGNHGQVELRGDEPGLQPRVGERDQAGTVVGGAVLRPAPSGSSQRTFSRPRL